MQQVFRASSKPAKYKKKKHQVLKQGSKMFGEEKGERRKGRYDETNGGIVQHQTCVSEVQKR